MGRDNGGKRAGGRKGWVRARVETDEGAYEASLRVERSQHGLGELLDDGRAYLGLWDAVPHGASTREDFLAIHKGAVRCVTLLEGGARSAGRRED
jgi:hypothetical protein